MRRNRVVLGAAIALALLVLVLLLWRGGARRGALAIEVTASERIFAVGETVEVVAHVTEGGKPVPLSECWFQWSADNGLVMAGEGEGTFRPDHEGLARVTVQAGRVGQKASVTASIDFRVLSVPMEQRRDDKPGEVAAGNPPPAEMNGPPPVIDAITLDKTEICRGEFVMVGVQAHDPRGDDWSSWLNYQVDGYSGSSIPLFIRGDDDNHNPHFVTVFSKNNQAWTTQQVPEITIKDCESVRLGRLSYRLVPNTQADFAFRSDVEWAPTQKPFVAESFEWDFGDGSAPVTTAINEAEHSYRHRPQVSAYSTFVVQVRMRDKAGEVVVGRETLTLMNHAFVVRDPAGKHYVEIEVELTPRYPVRGKDGVVRQTAYVWHHEKQALHIEKVQAFDYTDQGDRLDDTSFDPLTFLGTSELPPAGVRVKVALTKDDQEYLLYRTFQIEGTAADGTPASGSFSLMVPGTVDRDASEKVADAALKERILAAMKLLGKQSGDTVTDEEMMQLEERGLLPHYNPPPEPGGTGINTPNEDRNLYFPSAKP